MPSTSSFSALNVARGGLKASQTMVDTASKNISNAGDSHYTRQRAVSQSLPYRTSQDQWHFEVAGGTKTVKIERVHDEFVYERHRKATTLTQEADYMQQSLKHISIYFPEIDGFGVSNELDNYFNAWSNLITNPSESANKVTLGATADRLADTIKHLRRNIKDFQEKIDDEIILYADEINHMTTEIAHLNSEIFRASENEKKISNNITPINELKDRRDELELAISKLVNIEVDKSAYTSNNTSGEPIIESGADYVLSISGFNIVDGTKSGKVVANEYAKNKNFVDLKYVRQDHREFSMSSAIHSGKIGAIFKLRGTSPRDNGDGFDNGIIQKYLDHLDSFTKGFIERTNSIYSTSTTDKLQSNKQVFQDTQRTITTKIPEINKGSFFIRMFDIDDKLVGKKEIFINDSTNITEVINQINSNNDDNNDGAPSNDIDDIFVATLINDAFYIDSKINSGKYKISIDDNGTNFAGALGLNRFFDGDNAYNIKLNLELQKRPENISSYSQDENGKSLIANEMTQLRYDEINFKGRNGNIKTTLSDYLTNLITQVSSDGAIAIDNYETKDTIDKQIKAEFDAIGKVSIDEELIDLIRFQAGYTANAKVISTIDEMLDTVLGLKR